MATAELDDEVFETTTEESVTTWRYQQLREAGYPHDVAAELSRQRHVDLHVATDLVGRGCPTELALRILC